MSKDFRDIPASTYSESVLCALFARNAEDSSSDMKNPIFLNTSKTSCLLTPPLSSLSTLTKTSHNLSVDYLERFLGSYAVSIALW